MGDVPLYARRVAGVRTVDTDRPLDDLLNQWPYPFALAVLTNAESGGWREHAERRRATPEHPCDTSFGLVQRSACYPVRGIPGVDYRFDEHGRLLQTPDNITAVQAWYWDAEHALSDAGPIMTKNIADAVATLTQFYDEADPQLVLLLACCWWNSPNLGGSLRVSSARYWLASNLAEMDAFHFTNRETYRAAITRCLGAIAQQETPTMSDQNTDTMAFTPPTFPEATDLPSALVAIKDAQNKITLLNQQQHFQTEILRSLGQPMTDAERAQFVRTVVDALDPAHKGQWRTEAPKA